MRVVRDGKCVKIIPKKYESVVEGFAFTSEKKRLQPSERFALLGLLLLEHFSYLKKNGNIQEAYAAIHFLTTGIFEIVMVNKRGSNCEYRVKANGVEINVYSDLVSDCPKEYLKQKYEL